MAGFALDVFQFEKSSIIFTSKTLRTALRGSQRFLCFHSGITENSSGVCRSGVRWTLGHYLWFVRLFGIAADLGLQIFQHLIRVQTGNAVLQKSLPQPFPVPGPLPRQRIINELFWRLYTALLYEKFEFFQLFPLTF